MNGKCPYCGVEIKGYMESQSDYGSPIRVCRKCGKSYLDRRYHEIAIEGIGTNALSIKRDAKIALLGFAFFAVGFLLNLGMVLSSDKYNLRLVFIQLIAIILIIFALGDAVMIKTGKKEKRLEKKRMESVERLKNKEYARTLAELGYNVPNEYL